MDFNGYIQVYTGNGKGKTTAALGLALRAAGSGKKVYIAQFMKKTNYSELDAVNTFLKDYVTIEQFGVPDFHYTGNTVTAEEKEAAIEGINAVTRAVSSGKYDIIILDEANMVAHFKILDLKYFLDILDAKPGNVELVLTGRNAPEEFIEKADLVTEMKEIKHYYTQKVQARVGIEK
ncbi:MAG: cob(I)yrinic acid a,c-diamide adenosyltransferase [bacterium]|nr:cob(I)yrinic acid a,c-diamide adenosyltransferase [bacterium]